MDRNGAYMLMERLRVAQLRLASLALIIMMIVTLCRRVPALRLQQPDPRLL